VFSGDSDSTDGGPKRHSRFYWRFINFRIFYSSTLNADLMQAESGRPIHKEIEKIMVSINSLLLIAILKAI